MAVMALATINALSLTHSLSLFVLLEKSFQHWLLLFDVGSLLLYALKFHEKCFCSDVFAVIFVVGVTQADAGKW